jgi:hypothetical protein
LAEPVIGKRRVIRPDVADARDFLDQLYGTAGATRRVEQAAPGNSRSTPDRYLTSFSRAEEVRRWACGDIATCDFSAPTGFSAGPWSAIIASHNTFNSESAIRLSLIRSWRIAKETNCAVS